MVHFLGLSGSWDRTLKLNSGLATWRRVEPENQGKAIALIHWLSRRHRTDGIRAKQARPGACLPTNGNYVWVSYRAKQR